MINFTYLVHLCLQEIWPMAYVHQKLHAYNALNVQMTYTHIAVRAS